MKFCVSRMYCKYVINALSKAVLKIRSISIKDEALEDELYQSYLKLEKLLKQEFYQDFFNYIFTYNTFIFC